MNMLNDLAAEHVGDAPGDVRAACPLCAKPGRDDAVNITVKPDGAVVAHCHRCGENGTARPGKRPAARTRLVSTCGISARPSEPARHTRPPEDHLALWESGAEGADHPYLTRKLVGAHGVRVKGDELLVPMRNVGGELVGVQKIAADGAKMHTRGAKKTGAYHLIGEVETDSTIIIAEGYATGATIYEATGIATAIAFDCSNLEPVAKALRAKRIVIAADDDHRTKGNPGMTKATEAARAVGGLLAVPDFGDDRPNDATDFNDLARLRGAHAVKAAIAAATREAAVQNSNMIVWSLPETISVEEWKAARPSPDCIVENHDYADLHARIAPGGTGKTTLELYENVHIVLGRSLYGCAILRPGPVLFVTAEDRREMLVARLRDVCMALNLSDDEMRSVRNGVRISDVSGAGFKLTTLVDDAVVPSPMVDIIIEQALPLQIARMVIDPIVSFGIGESRVNDAEQGMIEAGRRMRNALNCSVRFIQHTGKANAREKALDQYAGRGGSALADGARMVSVMQPLTSDEWRNLAGAPLLDGETGIVMARPKLSYVAPQPNILIGRRGYAFTHTIQTETDVTAQLGERCGQLLQVLETDGAKDVHHTQRSLEALNLMPRAALRDAVSMLKARGQVEAIADTRKGGRQSYLRVIAAPPNAGAPWGNGP